MKVKNLFVLISVLLAIISAGCSNEDSDAIASNPNSIIGTWELKMVYYQEGDNQEILPENRDLYKFSSNGQVKVLIQTDRPLLPDLPNYDGEYDYSYDKRKQIILLLGKSLKCIVSNGEMSIEGEHFGADDGLYYHKFIFIKKYI